MRCYYRNGISCGVNGREFEDQSVIKGKIKIKWDKTKLVSHLGVGGGHFVKRENRRRRRGRIRRRRGFHVWIAMVLYGFVNICWICMVWILGFVI